MTTGKNATKKPKYDIGDILEVISNDESLFVEVETIRLSGKAVEYSFLHPDLEGYWFNESVVKSRLVREVNDET